MITAKFSPGDVVCRILALNPFEKGTVIRRKENNYLVEWTNETRTWEYRSDIVLFDQREAANAIAREQHSDLYPFTLMLLDRNPELNKPK